MNDLVMFDSAAVLDILMYTLLTLNSDGLQHYTILFTSLHIDFRTNFFNIYS